MKIQIGEIYLDKVTGQKTLYPNKTRKYLLPCLKAYGDEFITKLNSVFKVAVGIGDIVFERATKRRYDKEIFILLDTKTCSSFFKKFLTWIRLQPMYVDDYVYDNIQQSHFHMVVLSIPPKFYESIEKFRLGQYSKMYQEEDFTLFDQLPESKKVFIKDSNYRITFVNRLNKLYNSSVTPEDWDGNELELPPTIKHNVFSHHLKT